MRSNNKAYTKVKNYIPDYKCLEYPDELLERASKYFSK